VRGVAALGLADILGPETGLLLALADSAGRSFGTRLRNQKTPVLGWGQGRDIARTTCVPPDGREVAVSLGII
jgi:hypothetical protein